MKPKEHYPILNYINPQYDKITLFTMSFACCLLLISGVLSSKWDIQECVPTWDEIKFFVVIIFFLVGLVLSLYHAFTDRPKTSFEKYFMLLFAVILNGFIGILAGIYFLVMAKGWLIIFPFLNIFNSVVLVFLFRLGILNENNISDQNVSGSQIVLAGSTVFIVFAISQYLLDLIWIETLSICLAYATNINRVVQTFFLEKLLNK